MNPRKLRFLDPDAKRRPPNYASRSVQRKLLILVGGLCFVVWAMQQAGRPDTWQWLVAMDQAAKSKQTESIAQSTSPDNNNALAPPDVTPEAADTSQQRPLTLALAHPTQWQVEAVFWNFAIAHLTHSERFAIIAAMEKWCSADLRALASGDADLESALQRLTRLRHAFDRQIKTSTAAASFNPSPLAEPSDLLENETAAMEPSAQDELPSLNDQPLRLPNLFQVPFDLDSAQASAVEDEGIWLTRFWDQQRAPGAPETDPSLPLAVNSGQTNSSAAGQRPAENISAEDRGAAEQPDADRSRETTIDELDPIARMEAAVQAARHWRLIRTRLVDPALIEQVVDRTRLGRPEERATWLRLIQRATELSPNRANPVTRENLMGQADTFRGQWVTVSGTIRRVEKQGQSNAAVAELTDSDSYLVVWLQPGVAGQGPYCIYTWNHPELEAMAENGVDPRRPASLSAVFFKLYPYPVSDSKTAVCPVLLTPQIKLSPLAIRPPAARMSSAQWLYAIAGIAVLAIVLAIGARVSTSYRSANPLAQRQRDRSSVQWLDQAAVETKSAALGRLASQAAKQPTMPPQENFTADE